MEFYWPTPFWLLALVVMLALLRWVVIKFIDPED
jgi:hypothetical protein